MGFGLVWTHMSAEEIPYSVANTLRGGAVAADCADVDNAPVQCDTNLTSDWCDANIHDNTTLCVVQTVLCTKDPNPNGYTLKNIQCCGTSLGCAGVYIDKQKCGSGMTIDQQTGL
jgi:hypothetical protein